MNDETEDSETHGDEPDFNTVMHAETEAPVKSRGGISRASAILLFMLASLLGGAIGWMGPKFFTASDNTPDLSAALDAKTKTNRELVAALEEIVTQNQAAAKTSEENLRTLTQEVETLTAQIETLQETAAEPTTSIDDELVADLKNRIATLEGLSAKDGDLSQGAGAMLERFEALETEQKSTAETLAGYEDLRAQIDRINEQDADKPGFPEPSTVPINIPAVVAPKDRLDALLALVDTFPRGKMLEAVTAQEAIAAEKPSWLQRTLSKHVKVRDNDALDPRTIIAQAETALEGGHVTETLTLIAQLNPPVRAVASDWVAAAKKSAKAIEQGQ